MPANLTPAYLDAERRYRDARSPAEKIACLEEMLAVMPKHKGTEKLQKELRTRLAKLHEVQSHRPATHRVATTIDRQGAGQAVLCGPPNSGKSQLLASLTRAQPEIAPYPFTTRQPLVGMIEYEDVAIQLIDTPPLVLERTDPVLNGILRHADLRLLVVDLGADDVLDASERYGARLDELALPRSRRVLVGSKLDLAGAAERAAVLRDLYPAPFPVLAVSARDGRGLEELKVVIFHALDVIRVYTKAPGKPIERRDPVVLARGATVLDAARSIHKDFAERLHFARIWTRGGEQGLRVEKTHLLGDGDVVEFHV